MVTGLANSEAVILSRASRAIRPEEGDLSPDAARSLLKVRLPAADQQRAQELAAKASEGSLSPVEQIELDSYRGVGRLLELMKSRARRSLQHSEVV